LNKTKVHRQIDQVGISPLPVAYTSKVPTPNSNDQNKKDLMKPKLIESNGELFEFWEESQGEFFEKNKKVPEVINSYGGKSIRKAVEEITRRHWSQG
jgi:hypothetical protein